MGAVSMVMARKLLLKFMCEFCRSFVVVRESREVVFAEGILTFCWVFIDE